MSSRAVKLVKRLGQPGNRFDPDSRLEKMACLEELAAIRPDAAMLRARYAEILLFICAYPPDKGVLTLAEKELSRITAYLKKDRKLREKMPVNCGLPFTKFVSSFSHDFLRWLYDDPSMKIEVDRFENTTHTLNEILKLTLSSLEKSETTAGLDNDALLEVLLVKKKNRIRFLLDELGKLNDMPFIKDHLFDSLGMYTAIRSDKRDFSFIYNRIPVKAPYFHNDLVKSFDYRKLIDTPLMEHTRLSDEQAEQAIRVVKYSMALTDRETDPVTYLDNRSFRLYELERGISVAIYGMIPGRQLPLESYVGYTLFKNGFPAAYGGSWIFGAGANFGINIFESFRGAESGYMMCQLLRVFRQVFKVSYFEVEPYQFGLDNPDGISTGAFWFYYRFGFRPFDKKLSRTAAVEFRKISRRNGYRTSSRILKMFTGSTMVLQLGKRTPVKVADITDKVIRYIHDRFDGDRISAGRKSIADFKKMAGIRGKPDHSGTQVLKEVALWAAAFGIRQQRRLKLLKQMIHAKPDDVYGYQELLLKYFSGKA